MVSMPTLETVVNTTSVPMGLLTNTAALEELSGTRTVSTVTGQLMWTAVQVDINIIICYYLCHKEEKCRPQQQQQPQYLSLLPL